MHSKDFRRLWSVVLAALSVSGVSLQAQHMNAVDAPCRTAGPDAEKTRCFIAEAQAAESEMNAVYIKVREALAPSDQSKLQIAQRLWVQFRDANCAAERGLYEGGSAAPMAGAACVAADTRQRMTELNTMYGWLSRK
jgi:uncharacterized protein YecT (DUF1311 family)